MNRQGTNSPPFQEQPLGGSFALFRVLEQIQTLEKKKKFGNKKIWKQIFLLDPLKTDDLRKTIFGCFLNKKNDSLRDPFFMH